MPDATDSDLTAIDLLRATCNALPQMLARANYPSRIQTVSGTLDVTYSCVEDNGPITAQVPLDLGDGLFYADGGDDLLMPAVLAVKLSATSKAMETEDGEYELRFADDDGASIDIIDLDGDRVDSVCAEDGRFGELMAVLIDANR